MYGRFGEVQITDRAAALTYYSILSLFPALLVVVALLARSDYEAPFGSFSGSLNGLPVDSALGVMEAHDAVW